MVGRRSTPKLANMETVAYVLMAVSLLLFLFFASSRRENGSEEILLHGKGTPWWRRRLRDPKTREETSLELLSALRADDWRSNQLPLVVLLDEPLIAREIDQVVPALVDLVESRRFGVSPSVPGMAIMLLGKIGAVQAIPTLLAVMKHRGPSLAHLAIRALGAIGPSAGDSLEVVEALERFVRRDPKKTDSTRRNRKRVEELSEAEWDDLEESTLAEEARKTLSRIRRPL